MSFRYIQSLIMRSATVQQAIEREQQRLKPDWVRLLQMKKIRLVIKDKLQRLGLAPQGSTRLAPVPVLRLPQSRRI